MIMKTISKWYNYEEEFYDGHRYDYERPHQSLDNFTPASFYGNKEKKVG